jgi:hypothetical protein
MGAVRASTHPTGLLWLRSGWNSFGAGRSIQQTQRRVVLVGASDKAGDRGGGGFGDGGVFAWLLSV